MPRRKAGDADLDTDTGVPFDPVQFEKKHLEDMFEYGHLFSDIDNITASQALVFLERFLHPPDPSAHRSYAGSRVKMNGHWLTKKEDERRTAITRKHAELQLRHYRKALEVLRNLVDKP